MENKMFGNLRRGLIDVKAGTRGNLEFEEVGDWPIQDSGLFPDKSLEKSDVSYGEVFRDLYPETQNLRDYIETCLADKKGRAVGLEIGGIGSRLFGEFSPSFFERSLSASLIDKRKDAQKVIDTKKKHKVLEVDAFASTGWQQIKKWLGEEKADIIFEKMHGALTHFPGNNTDVLMAYFNRWLGVLNDGGMMLVETPPIEGESFQIIINWLDEVKSGKVPQLEVVYKVETAKHRRKRIYLVLKKGAIETKKNDS